VSGGAEAASDELRPAAAAAELVARFGFPGAVVEAGGHDGGVAIIVLPDRDRDRFLECETSPLVSALRELGFRYVTLDLADER
jgi:PP-loop superfamily ATP-utilizing enzyme